MNKSLYTKVEDQDMNSHEKNPKNKEQKEICKKSLSHGEGRVGWSKEDRTLYAISILFVVGR